MMKPIILKAILVFTLFNVTCFIQAQVKPLGTAEKTTSVSAKPYKILTDGKQITIQSKLDIRSVLVWTSSGHRIVEQKEINAATYKFSFPAREKILFLMLETINGKRFTEKIGVQ